MTDRCMQEAMETNGTCVNKLMKADALLRYGVHLDQNTTFALPVINLDGT